MSAATADRLLFAYDARSGRLAAALDSARKVLGAGGCSLCSITHGVAGERRAWSACKARLGIDIDYLHRDELDGALRARLDGDLPAVLATLGEHVVLLLGRDELSRIADVEQLERSLALAAAARGIVVPGLGSGA